MPTHPRPADRQAAVQSARQLLSRRPIFLDTETTGLNPLDEVIELALLDADGQALFNSLLKPSRPIPVAASRVHGITDAAVAGAPTLADVAPQLLTLLAGRTIAVYNAEFDFKLLGQTAARWRAALPLEWSRWVCVMQLYSRFHGDWNPSYRSYRWQRLEAAARQCGVAGSQSHRAMDDARLARAVLRYMVGDDTA